MFVDIGVNYFIIDRVKLLYIYDEIDLYEVRDVICNFEFEWN